ncbi:CDGSH iron-sulfur domain-containing protein [Colwelliaceae bacterium 6441]
MSDPVRASDSPFIIDVEAGKNYMWCSCGRSNKQPFCDGSHSGTDFTPVMFKATESKKVFFCGCKQSSKQVLCDGSHNKS